MALFFDQSWFDAQLQARSLTHDQLAQALGLHVADLVAVWKDQRTLSVEEVRKLSEVLGQDMREISSRAGISTPLRDDGPNAVEELMQRVKGLEERMNELEAELRSRKSES